MEKFLTKVMLIVLVLIVIFSLGAAIAYFQDRDSRVLMMTQPIANDYEYVSLHVIESGPISWLFNWSGYVYVYPMISEKEGDYWNHLDPDDKQLESANINILFLEETDERKISYIVVCSSTEITTIEEAENIFWSRKTNLKKHHWFSPSNDGKDFFTLTCD